MTSLIRTIRDWMRGIPKDAAEEAVSLVEGKRPQADLNDALRKRIATFEQAWRDQDAPDPSG